MIMRTLFVGAMLFVGLLIMSCEPNHSQQQQKLELIAAKGMKEMYNTSLNSTKRTLLKGNEQISSWLKTNMVVKSQGVRIRTQRVLGGYLKSPECVALAVENVKNDRFSNVLVVFIPVEFRLPDGNFSVYIINDENDDNKEEEEWCDYCTGLHPPPNSFSDLSADGETNCVCVCSCNPKSQGPCGNECTDC